jgi:anhydro-N-acetylmuramic acid kinase
MKIYKVIGLMSGTSLDGVDVAFVHTDGESFIERKAFLSVPYDDTLREKIRAVFGKKAVEAHEAERALTEFHAEAIQKLGVSLKDIDLIGFHGQTILHAPEKGFTIQIGDGALLAAMTGVKVVNGFRTNDVKAGGQGAPLVPVYHQALAAKLEKPVVFLNIGGVANVTYVGQNGELIAFDTGPGNALIDDWMLRKTGSKFDEAGKLALSGKVNEIIVYELLQHPFFSAAVPKSLDRNAFASRACEMLSVEDGAATLAAFTVQAIMRAAMYFPAPPTRWIVAGGGRHNKYLMQQLQKNIKAPVVPIESLGLDGDATEAEAFAYLAVRSVRGLPLSFPMTTGVPKPTTGGILHACN